MFLKDMHIDSDSDDNNSEIPKEAENKPDKQSSVPEFNIFHEIAVLMRAGVLENYGLWEEAAELYAELTKKGSCQGEFLYHTIRLWIAMRDNNEKACSREMISAIMVLKLITDNFAAEPRMLQDSIMKTNLKTLLDFPFGKVSADQTEIEKLLKVLENLVDRPLENRFKIRETVNLINKLVNNPV